MTREEQIEKVINDDWNHLEGDCPDVAFRKGVKWADKNPHWHKYPKDRPQIEDQYLIITIDKSYIVADYRNSHFVIDLFGIREELQDRDVIAWMELPEPPNSIKIC